MLNIVLFGPPGAGKGTQSEKLIAKYNLVHLSTGDIFRANIKGETALGALAKSYMDQGQLVPDSVTISMLEAEVNKNPNAKGFIFDGFPRTKAQAQALDTLLSSKGTGITLMLALEVEEEELRKRLLLRGQNSGRPDDQNPEVIQKRIDVYNNETAPVKDFYTAQGKYKGVYGIGEIEQIFNALCAVIDSKIEKPAAAKTVVAKPVKPARPAGGKATKKATKKAAAKTAIKKATKKAVAKKSAKPARPKGGKPVAKKAAKKSTAKKLVKKVVAKKSAKPARPKGGKAVKKLVKKKVTKKAAPRPTLSSGRTKKVVKKLVAKKSAKKSAKKVVKKATKKSVKKALKKTAKKVAAKVVRSSNKKLVKKPVKKQAKKVVSKKKIAKKKK